MFFRIILRMICLWGIALPLGIAIPTSNKVSQGTSPSPKATATASQDNNKPIDLPSAVGQDIKGITIPQYDVAGHLSMLFSAEKARKVDEHEVELESLAIEFFEKEGKNITVHIPHSKFDLVTKILSSSTNGGPVSIKREDFEVTGQSATFDTVKRFGTMQGHVHTEIRNGSTTNTDEL